MLDVGVEEGTISIEINFPIVWVSVTGFSRKWRYQIILECVVHSSKQFR